MYKCDKYESFALLHNYKLVFVYKYQGVYAGLTVTIVVS
jgi:hypothetical protein